MSRSLDPSPQQRHFQRDSAKCPGLNLYQRGDRQTAGHVTNQSALPRPHAHSDCERRRAQQCQPGIKGQSWSLYGMATYSLQLAHSAFGRSQTAPNPTQLLS
ncbi:hypothetical protein MHYP_G00020940 [Metynnis hypsauchen]